MTQKKPIWTTTEAHARLKAYCAATSRTQLEVVSELILTQLDAEGKANTRSTEKKTKSSDKKGTDNRHFGGVWVV